MPTRTMSSSKSWRGRILARGFFTISEAIKPESQKHIVAVNCPALLYSAAREILVGLTGRGRFGKLTLPSITFIDEKTRFDPPPEPEPLEPPESEDDPRSEEERSGEPQSEGAPAKD